MAPIKTLLTATFFMAIGVTGATAECQIADAKLEEAILNNPQLRGPANRQAVRDLRSSPRRSFHALVVRPS